MAEILDLYDIHRNPTGETCLRGEPVPEGRYRLGVRIWIRNDRGQFLISQRHPRKNKPLFWEPTGGAVDAGEDTRAGAVRELSEELGIHVGYDEPVLLHRELCKDAPEFLDTYLLCWNGSLDELTLQETEVVDARWATFDELTELEARGVFEEEYRGYFGQVQHAPVAVCPMTMEDYDEIYALWEKTPGMGVNDHDDSPEGIARFLERNPGCCFVAKGPKGLIGTSLAGYDGRRGYLYHTAVLPETQGMGVGRALVNASLEALKRQGVGKSGIHVFNDNASGNRFWEKFGFVARHDVTYHSYKMVEMNEAHTK